MSVVKTFSNYNIVKEKLLNLYISLMHLQGFYNSNKVSSSLSQLGLVCKLHACCYAIQFFNTFFCIRQLSKLFIHSFTSPQRIAHCVLWYRNICCRIKTGRYLLFWPWIEINRKKLSIDEKTVVTVEINNFIMYYFTSPQGSTVEFIQVATLRMLK